MKKYFYDNSNLINLKKAIYFLLFYNESWSMY